MCSSDLTCKNTKPLEEDFPIEAKCPNCGKNIKRLKSKRGKVFYGCEGYPDCTYMSWDIPAGEKCPNCSEDMIVKLYKNSKTISCKSCGYSRKEDYNGTVQAEEELSQESAIDILNKLDEQNEKQS